MSIKEEEIFAIITTEQQSVCVTIDSSLWRRLQNGCKIWPLVLLWDVLACDFVNDRSFRCISIATAIDFSPAWRTRYHATDTERWTLSCRTSLIVHSGTRLCCRKAFVTSSVWMAASKWHRLISWSMECATSAHPLLSIARYCPKSPSDFRRRKRKLERKSFLHVCSITKTRSLCRSPKWFCPDRSLFSMPVNYYPAHLSISSYAWMQSKWISDK